VRINLGYEKVESEYKFRLLTGHYIRREKRDSQYILINTFDVFFI